MDLPRDVPPELKLGSIPTASSLKAYFPQQKEI
jgi:hypothetical protein